MSPADVLVEPEWLAAHLGEAEVCVVDVRGKVLPPGNEPRYRGKRQDYEAGHVPGAVFVDWTRDIVDPDDPVPVQIAKPEAFARRMGQLGIGDGTTVIAYDDYDHAFAGRLSWALRYYGHDAVRILDGGWARWVAEGRPVSTPGPRATRRPADAQATSRAAANGRRESPATSSGGTPCSSTLGQPNSMRAR